MTLLYVDGPDQIIPSSSLTTWDSEGAVKFRDDDDGNSELPPISVPTMLKNASSSEGHRIAMAVKRDGVWLKWTYKRYYEEARIVAKAFIKLGLERFHSVGILGFNAPEWSLSLLGSVFAGGFGAGIYATNSPDACKFIAEHSRADILVVEDGKQLEKILEIRSKLPGLKAIVQYLGKPKKEVGVYSWDELMEMGRKEESDERLDDRLKRIAINNCCCLIYTSGTTGTPKGVMISHDNVTWTARTANTCLKLGPGDVGVSFLPLSHSAAQMMDIWMPIAGSMSMYFCDRNALKGSLVNTLKEVRPTYFFGVPRVYEKIQEKMQEIGKRSKGIKKVVADWAKKTGLNHNLKAMDGEEENGISYPIAKKLVFKKVRDNLGLSRAKLCGVGAAPVSRQTLEYFLSLDIPLLECYGMSESSGPQTGNRPGHHKLGTIGQNVGKCKTKIFDPDNEGKGEVCMYSRNVMMGYLFNEEKTKETIDSDGWLHSGDIGTVTEDGYFKITGRIKELLITAGGENIPPVHIEDAIRRELPVVSNAMVIGDRKKFLSCLITLKVEMDPDTLEPKQELAPLALDWCRSIGSKANTVGDIIFGKDPLVMEAIQQGIDRVNAQAISNAQKIQKFALLQEDFSIPGGELGPTLKVKRHFVMQKYDTQIKNFYNC